MARKTAPLSDTQVRRAKPQERLYKLFDGGGLFLAVLPSGAKSWRIKYRDPLTGRERTRTLGLYPDISLADARRMRERFFEGEKSEERTLQEIAEAFLEKKRISESHKTRQRRRLERYILPKFGGKAPAEITRAELAAVIRQIAERGTVETAKRVFSLVSEVMRFAVANGWAEGNPLGDIRPSDIIPSSPERHYRSVTDPEELRRLMEAIRDYRGIDITRLALEFLALTAVRPGNVRAAEWSQIDREARLWSIPTEAMKTRRPHSVPLSSRAMEILDLAATYSADQRLIFPSILTRNRPMSENTLNMALKRIGWGDRIVSHGFRSAFSTIAHEHGWPPHIIEAALAHREANQVKAAYNRATYLDERRKLMEWWAGVLG